MIKEYALYKILPNPFQTRERVDDEYIRALAKSISEQGLLQIPSARRIPEADDVELAFGHNRLAAFRYLCEIGATGFGSMPLNIVEMSDEEMFKAAVAENSARKDLTPIEEAKAMLVYRDQFKKNSEEIGALFNLSDSAVRNKLRLLDLPDEVKSLVGKTLTESAAREVLAFQGLPEEVKEEKTWRNGEQRTYEAALKEMIAEGVEAGEMKELVDEAVRQGGGRMDRKLWKNTDELVGDGIIGLCRGCAFLTAREGVDYCLKESCFEAKEMAHRMRYLSQANLLTGIAVLDNEKYGYNEYSDFGYGHEEAMKRARENGCENLRLKFEQGGGYHDSCSLKEAGFEHVKVVCGKRNGQCTCIKAANAGVEVEGGSEEDLKAARREMLQAQRNEQALIQSMKGTAENMIFNGLEAMSFETWREVLRKVAYDTGLKDATSMGTLLVRLVKLVVDKSTWGGRESVLEQLNKLLNACGLKELDISFEVPEPSLCDGAESSPCETSNSRGKTLIDVLAGDVEHGG